LSRLTFRNQFSKSKLHDFYEAKGQYDVYRKGLKWENIEQRLYLAVEESVFNSFFQKSLIKEIVEEDKISLIVYSVPNKEIISWHQY
jgi:XisH protein